MIGVPEAAAPDLKNKSFTITADVEVNEGASGMIFTQGGNTAGWAFYMIDGKLRFTHNFIDLEHYTVTADSAVAAGKHKVAAKFVYEGANELGKGGSVTLIVDGNPVGSGKIEKTTPLKYSLSESQDIGRDTGTAVVYDYETPFVFKGNIAGLVLELNN